MEERVQKIIANAGICARRKAETLIEQGKVKVNGKKITIGDKADLAKDIITVDGKKIVRQRRVYYAFHKPKGYLTSLSDPSGKKTIKDIIKIRERVIPIGRLDYNTEGLLLLTNDGDFANKIMHPRYEVDKTYHAYLDKPFSEDGSKKIRRGIRLEDGMTRPAAAKVISPDGKKVSIRLHEGRNRIVRRIFEALGYKVMRLVRVKVGTMGLQELPVGRIRKLSYQEVQDMLKKSK